MVRKVGVWEWKALEQYVQTLKDIYGLRDWEVIILRHEAPSDPRSAADIKPVYGQRRAIMRVGKQFWDFLPSEHRWCLCHELTHCHYDVMCDFMDKLKDDHRLPVEFAVAYEVNMEHTVDNIASAIAKLMPLPHGGSLWAGALLFQKEKKNGK